MICSVVKKMMSCITKTELQSESCSYFKCIQNILNQHHLHCYLKMILTHMNLHELEMEH